LDASPKSQHAIHNSTALWITREFETSGLWNQAASRLVVLACFFLLWVGEHGAVRVSSIRIGAFANFRSARWVMSRNK
jgi:hypothetical protein